MGTAGQRLHPAFEAMIMAMVPAMPVNAVARMVGEHDTRLWRVIHHYVDRPGRTPRRGRDQARHR